MPLIINWLILAGLTGAPLRAEEPAPTSVLSETDAERLRTVQGITLQWIEANERGHVEVSVSDRGVWHLTGVQVDASGASVRVEGVITEIGEDYFLLDGTVAINDTPDPGRACSANKIWRFGATQRRSYYRLREFEWCDYLTDYVDIYFAPGLR
ncbi:MAG: hypothetical protein V2I27_08870 [Erythrobacter sp.]|jgi:hypothetical protein|nr:hypothetical protein [Erythrobacter sp.]